MATPTVPQRRLLAYAAKKGTTWGTAVALGATDGMHVYSCGVSGPSAPYLPAKEADTPFTKTGVLGQLEAIAINIAFDARYDAGALALLEALFMGTAGAPTDLTGAYAHTFQFADNPAGFACMAWEKPSKIFEVQSAKPTGMTFNIGDGLLKGAITLIGNQVIDDSAVNTATQMDAVTYDDDYNRITFEQISVKMNAESGGAVASETALEYSNLDISFQRPMDSVHAGGGATIIEPLQNDHPVVTVKIDFPRMNATNDDYFQTFNAETAQKILVSATGALITGALYYDKKFNFPRMKIVNIEYPDGGEITPASITLQSEQAAANPTGMDYARPYIVTINTQLADYLA